MIEIEPAFFVDGFHCTQACPADVGNRVQFPRPVRRDSLRVGDPGRTRRRRQAGRARGQAPGSASAAREFELDEGRVFSLEDAGFDPQPPARTFAVTVDGIAAFGRRSDARLHLGRRRSRTGTSGRSPASATATACGNGPAGQQLPFYARNFRDVTQWSQRVALPDLMPTIAPAAAATRRTRGSAVQRGAAVAGPAAAAERHARSHSVARPRSVAARSARATPAWCGPPCRDGEPIERAVTAVRRRRIVNTRSTLVQVTNLGLSVKDSPQNTLVFVTRLDTGAPVPSARVSIVNRENQHGVDAAPPAPTASPSRRKRPASATRERWWRFAFVVTAEKDGDVAYVGSDWNEGITPWELRVSLQPRIRRSRCCAARSSPTAASTGSARKCGSRRSCATTRRRASGCCRPGTSVLLSVRDGQDRAVDERTVDGERLEQRRVVADAAGRRQRSAPTRCAPSSRATSRCRRSRRSFVRATSPGPDTDDRGRLRRSRCRRRSWWRRIAGRTSAST